MDVHHCSDSDLDFLGRMEACTFPDSQFGHRAHLRLAYVYLSQSDPAQAVASMRDTLQGFLNHNGVDPAKYHETLTRAWILAVHHFMHRSGSSSCADAFIDQNPEMMDAEIMLTHYSAEALFSEAARAEFVAPDKDPIPRYR